MPTTYRQSSWAYFSNEPAGRREVRSAWAIVGVSTAIFAAAVAYAGEPLPQVPAFIPVYVTALVIFDLITAVLLFGQFRALKLLPMLVLAGAYLFTAAVTVAYALIYPGFFAPTGLLGAGPQTSSALYMFWHAGFPLAVAAYALAKRNCSGRPALQRLKASKARAGILLTIAMVLLLVAAFTAFATSGHRFLPVFLDGHHTTVVGKQFLVAIWLLSLAALGLLWRSKPHTVLDLWLHVVLCVWLFDLALAAVLNTGRYDLGWYVGRIYGLLSAGFLLIVLLSENARHYARLVQVTAELRTANEALWTISMKDGLTELANRRHFDAHLAAQLAVALRQQRPLALVLVDVDHFKAYNDCYGHQAGDECLQQIAAALGACCHRPTDLAARYGGEEFAMILPDTDRVGAGHIAAAAQAAIAGLRIPHRQSPTADDVSISSGVALMLPGGGMAAEQLIKAADQALYRAKRNGRNQVAVMELSVG